MPEGYRRLIKDERHQIHALKESGSSDSRLSISSQCGLRLKFELTDCLGLGESLCKLAVEA